MVIFTTSNVNHKCKCNGKYNCKVKILKRHLLVPQTALISAPTPRLLPTIGNHRRVHLPHEECDQVVFREPARSSAPPTLSTSSAMTWLGARCTTTQHRVDEMMHGWEVLNGALNVHNCERVVGRAHLFAM